MHKSFEETYHDTSFQQLFEKFENRESFRRIAKSVTIWSSDWRSHDLVKQFQKPIQKWAKPALFKRLIEINPRTATVGIVIYSTYTVERARKPRITSGRLYRANLS